MLLATILQETGGFAPTDAARQFAQFLGWFGIFGPLGFRFVVMGRAGSPRQPERELAAVDDMRANALRSAALIGLGGALVYVATLLPWTGRKSLLLVCAAVLFVAYAVARRGSTLAWVVALLAGIVLVFRNLPTGRWATLVNPIHMTAAALWIGTLFVVVSAGLPAVLRAPLRERRGPLVAELITRFSPLALVSATVLGLSGIVTAWRHIGSWPALWGTAYGRTLLVKLCFVAAVAALGAWNWRRMSPRLGTEEASRAIRRSATSEVVVATIVLVITAVLVSLPAPAEMREHRPRTPLGGRHAPAVVAPGAPGSVPTPGRPGAGRR